MKSTLEILPFEPENHHLRRQFLRLPFQLYRDDPNWVPPLMMDQRGIFNRNTNSFYRHGEALFLLALKNGRPFGRLAILHNLGGQAGFEQDAAHFYLYETSPDAEITHRLFDHRRRVGQGARPETSSWTERHVAT